MKLCVVTKSAWINFYFLGNYYLQLQQQLNVLTIFVTSQLQEYNGNLWLIIISWFCSSILKTLREKSKKQLELRLKIHQLLREERLLWSHQTPI